MSVGTVTPCYQSSHPIALPSTGLMVHEIEDGNTHGVTSQSGMRKDYHGVIVLVFLPIVTRIIRTEEIVSPVQSTP
jgi:hypothetical protein